MRVRTAFAKESTQMTMQNRGNAPDNYKHDPTNNYQKYKLYDGEGNESAAEAYMGAQNTEAETSFNVSDFTDLATMVRAKIPIALLVDGKNGVPFDATEDVNVSFMLHGNRGDEGPTGETGTPGNPGIPGTPGLPGSNESDPKVQAHMGLIFSDFTNQAVAGNETAKQAEALRFSSFITNDAATNATAYSTFRQNATYTTFSSPTGVSAENTIDFGAYMEGASFPDFTMTASTPSSVARAGSGNERSWTLPTAGNAFIASFYVNADEL